MPWKGSLEQFKFDYRPVIIPYAVFCLWQGISWLLDPSERFTAHAFHKMDVWAGYFGQPIQIWGVPMIWAGFLILSGTFMKHWKVRWVGYAIASLTFLAVAESIRQSGIIYPEASLTGFRTYVYLGVFPIIMANVAQFHAKRRTQQKGSP